MPTTEQLDTIWESEMEFPETRRDAVLKPLSFKEFTGKKIGSIVFDKENKDFKIIPDTEWKPIGTAPKSGITIEVSYGDGSDESENCLAFWSERPVCMGGATVMIPAGWATAGNETDKNLPLDEPKLWREE